MLDVAINLPAMPNRKQMNFVPIQIEGVNYPIVSDTSPVPVESFESVVRIY